MTSWIVLFLLLVIMVALYIRRRMHTQIHSAPWHGQLERDVMSNDSWRRVLATTGQLQVAAMSVPPGETLGWEVHDDSDQFFRVERGTANISLCDNAPAPTHASTDTKVHTYTLAAGDAAIVPRGWRHNVYNTGREDLKLYTIYAPPHHNPQIHDRTHADEIAREYH